MKKSVTVITLLLLIAGMLSGCGNKPNGDLQLEFVKTAETETENPTAEPEIEETQPKFDVAQDVLLSYEYDSNGEISKVIFMYDIHTLNLDGIYEFEELETTYDASGRLESIKTNSITIDQSVARGRIDISIKADYNADGQITSLAVAQLQDVRQEERNSVYNYDVVYNSPDDCIKVYIYNQKDSDAASVDETRTYDSNYNFISNEFYTTYTNGRTGHIYKEYVNGILSHYYEYDNSTGQLLYERIYHDNGKLSESFTYDEKTGELEIYFRYDRNGDEIERKVNIQ